MSKMTTDERTPLRTPFADGSKVVLGDLAVYERSVDRFRQPCWVATYRKPTPGGAARVVTFHNVEVWDKIMSDDLESGRARLVSRGEAGCTEATAFDRHFNSNVLEPVEWCLLDREYDDDLCAVHHRERLEQLRAEAD